MTDALKCISENTANFASGKYMSVRYLDVINPKEEDDRTEAEIIAQVKKAWGGGTN